MEGVFVGCGWCGGIAVLRHGPGPNDHDHVSVGYLALHAKNVNVLAAYSCSGQNVVSCVGTVPNGSPINTAAVGTFPFEVYARNADGATLTTSVTNYQVTETGQPTIRAAASRPR